VQTERIVLRPRSPGEAIELGLHLTRANWVAQLALAAALLLPIALIGWSLGQAVAPALLLTLIWFKPTIDRALLHQLSQDLLGEERSALAVLRAWRVWWRGGHAASLLWHRFNPARSLVLPIWQLERLTGRARNRRVRALAHNDRGAGVSLTLVATLIELSFLLSIGVLLGSLTPEQWTEGLYLLDWLSVAASSNQIWLVIGLAYLPVLVLVEPFYVGGGFGLYLNQRSRLEGWDLEPRLRAIVDHHARPELST
jgi:hypothetical protein